MVPPTAPIAGVGFMGYHVIMGWTIKQVAWTAVFSGDLLGIKEDLVVRLGLVSC